MNFIILCVLLSLIGNINGQYQNLTAIILATPECARNCSVPAVSGLTCRPTTVPELAECLCPNTDARRKISECVQNQCSYQNVLLAGRPSSVYCAPYPVPSRGGEIKTAVIVLLAVTMPFILLRIWSRGFIMRVMWWDDYTLALSSAVLIAWLAMNLPMVQLGFGKHVWNVNPKDGVPLAKMFFAAQLFYIFVQYVTKLSILICYLRIFPQRTFRIITLITFYFVFLKGTAYMFVVVFRCWPIASTWNRNIEGKCIHGASWAYVGAAFSIIEDVWILGLPVPMLRSLKIPRAQKLAVGAMFGIGIVACVTSMIRVKHIAGFGSPVDPTWDNIGISLWSLIENSVAVICASLPALRPLLSRYLPSIFGTLSTNQRSNRHYGYGMQDSTSKRSARERAEDNEENGPYGILGGNKNGSKIVVESRRNTRGWDAKRGREERDGDDTSGSSFNYGRENSQEGIRMETVFELNVTRPQEGHARRGRNGDFC